MKYTRFPFAGCTFFSLLVLSGCGGGGGGGTVSVSSPAPDTAFPAQVVLTSPTTTSSSVVAASLDIVLAKEGEEPSDMSDRKKSAEEISEVLEDSSKRLAFASAFDVARLIKRHAGYAPCYGPKMKYQNHINGATPPSGELPSGDLGIWLETVSNTDTTACAAAQLNRNIYAASHRVNAAMKLMALLRATSRTSSGSALAMGTSINLTAEMNALGMARVTFTEATLARDAVTGNDWTYTIKANFTHPDTSTSYPIELTLKHTRASGGASYPYNGLLTYKIGDDLNGGNCPSGSFTEVTRAGTLMYSRSSATALEVNHRSSQYCGDINNLPTNLVGGDGQLNPSATFDGTKGWADDFSRFAGVYNPADGAGSYAYAWQAGYGDSNTRILGVNLNTRQDDGSQDGEAFFGFGDVISTTTGQIKGMICNWAGPGNSHSYQDYVQRQFLRLNTASGKWETPSGGSNIRYAPTNSCQYTTAEQTTSSFVYDRDLDGDPANDTAPSLLAEINTSPTPSTFDLKDKGTDATLAEMMYGRGYRLPSNF